MQLGVLASFNINLFKIWQTAASNQFSDLSDR